MRTANKSRNSIQEKTGKLESLRFEKFKRQYLKSSNALQSALEAGYSEAYAKSNSYDLALKVRSKLGAALRCKGTDEARVAEKITEKLDAQMVKWNPELKQWDRFIDHGTQLKAIELAMDGLDAYPKPQDVGGNTFNSIKVVFNVARPQRSAPVLEGSVQ